MQLYTCFCPNQVKISDVSKWETLFPNRTSQMSCVPERDKQRCRKILILNLNTFFLGILKKSEVTQKLDHLIIFKLPKFGGDWAKTAIHFFRFLSVLQK